MMKCKSLLLLMLAAMSIPAAQIKDVRFGCDANGCQMNFQFGSNKNLPSFFQKYDASSHQLMIGFSETDFALGDGIFDVVSNEEIMEIAKMVLRKYNAAVDLDYFYYFLTNQDFLYYITLYYRVVVILVPLQGLLCYTEKDVVDWFISPTA